MSLCMCVCVSVYVFVYKMTLFIEYVYKSAIHLQSNRLKISGIQIYFQKY